MNELAFAPETQPKRKWKPQLRDFAMLMVFLLLAVLALRPGWAQIVSLLLTPVLLYLFFFDEFYLLPVVFLFFDTQLLYTSTFTVFRVFTLLYILKFIFGRKKVTFHPVLFPSLIVFALYLAFAMMNADTTSTINHYIAMGQTPPSDFYINFKIVIGIVVDFIFLFCLTSVVTADRKLFERLCTLIVVTAILSGIYGYFAGNAMEYFVGYDAGEMATVPRYMGSFNDPNYAGFFFNISIFLTLSLPAFKKLYVKIPVLLVFYYFIIASGSLTAILFHCVAMVVYLIMRYRQKAIIPILAVVVAAALSAAVIATVPALRNLPAVQNLETRLLHQQEVEQEDSENNMASGRGRQWKLYFNYFSDQSWERKLFGGSIITTNILDPDFSQAFDAGPHQSYITALLTFGIFGALVYVLLFLVKSGMYARKYLKTRDHLDLILFMFSFAWLFYAATLDFFPDWRFMFFYFL